jgi:hypothetical protein
LIGFNGVLMEEILTSLGPPAERLYSALCWPILGFYPFRALGRGRGIVRVISVCERPVLERTGKFELLVEVNAG